MRRSDFALAAGTTRALHLLVPALPTGKRNRGGRRTRLRPAEKRGAAGSHPVDTAVHLEYFAVDIDARAAIENQIEPRAPEGHHVIAPWLAGRGYALQRAEQLQHRHARHDDDVEQAVVDQRIWGNRVAAADERGVAHGKQLNGGLPDGQQLRQWTRCRPLRRDQQPDVERFRGDERACAAYEIGHFAGDVLERRGHDFGRLGDESARRRVDERTIVHHADVRRHDVRVQQTIERWFRLIAESERLRKIVAGSKWNDANGNRRPRA